MNPTTPPSLKKFFRRFKRKPSISQPAAVSCPKGITKKPKEPQKAAQMELALAANNQAAIEEPIIARIQPQESKEELENKEKNNTKEPEQAQKAIEAKQGLKIAELSIADSFSSVLKVKDFSINSPQATIGPLSLDLGAGEVAIILSLEHHHNSELMAALSGINNKYTGSATICEHSVGDLEGKRLLGYVPKAFALYNELTCGEFLSLFVMSYDVDKHYGPYMVREALNAVRLGNYFDTAISAISDDYLLRRLGIARALIHDPRVLLVDDVLRYIEPQALHSFIDILSGIRNTGKVMVLSTDRLAGLQSLYSSLCLISDGHVLFQGPKEEVWTILGDFHSVYMQLLDGPSVDICLEALENNERVSSLAQGVSDNGLLRFLYRGSNADLDASFLKLLNKGAKIVSCSEDANFLAK